MTAYYTVIEKPFVAEQQKVAIKMEKPGIIMFAHK
jgi:hypothetical protein